MMSVMCLGERHLRRPYGTSEVLLVAVYPTLKRGANNPCAYGAVASALRKIGWKMRGVAINMKLKIACLVICILSAAGLAIPQSSSSKPQTEPSIFYPDDGNRGFDGAHPPSKSVLDALLKTPEAKENWNRLQKLTREELQQLFIVIRVHLKDSDETDEVVLGKDPMSGADCDWFWIVRDKGDQAQVLLFENTYGVYLLKSRTNGYRDIRSVGVAGGMTYTNIFHYDGQRYIPVHKFQKETTP
jgi:hypothetical protein